MKNIVRNVLEELCEDQGIQKEIDKWSAKIKADMAAFIVYCTEKGLFKNPKIVPARGTQIEASGHSNSNVNINIGKMIGLDVKSSYGNGTYVGYSVSPSKTIEFGGRTLTGGLNFRWFNTSEKEK